MIIEIKKKIFQSVILTTDINMEFVIFLCLFFIIK